MEEDVHEQEGCDEPQQTSLRNPHQQQLVPPSRHSLHSHSHSSSFIPLTSLAGVRQLANFPLSTGVASSGATATREGVTDSPSAKRGKYASIAFQAWPAPMQMNVNSSAAQQSSANPVFTHTLPLSPSSGPSSASASSFSQSSSPGSVQPAASGVMIMAASGSAALGGPQGAASSPAASHSPSHSLVPAGSTAGYNPTLEQHAQESTHVQAPSTTTRKGKFVSPAWKPQEMLALAKAWRLQYCGGLAESNIAPTGDSGVVPKAKTRSEKDLEVAEFLKQHGVQRDVKTAATKWDNMLGDFRRVNEWERGPERDAAGGKSYFRLSSAERKLHRLPASFDEEVFEEMTKFIGHRPRSSTHANIMVGPSGMRSCTAVASPRIPASTALTMAGAIDSIHTAALGPAGDASTSVPVSYKMQRGDHPDAVQLNMHVTDEERKLVSPSAPQVHSRGRSSGGGMQRVGRIKMIWEESVHIWGMPDDAQHGRLKVDTLNFLQADQLAFLDHHISPNAIEAFESGPLQGLSTDTFASGQQLKVFGRRAPPPARLHQLVQQAANTSSPDAVTPMLWDRTSYYLSCLKVPASTGIQALPNLAELSRVLKEPPPRDLRFPVRRDVFMDLPAGGRDHFFVASGEVDCREIIYEVVAPLIRSTGTSGVGKQFLVALWDDCINRIVKIFCADEIELIRSSDEGTINEPEDERINVCGLVRQLCLWRGEERGVSSGAMADDPALCLVSKLLWTYGDLPYILGYYAVGTTVTFCALSRSFSSDSTEKVLCTNLMTIGLSNPTERLSAMVPCWHIAQLLPLLADACARMCNVYSDYSRIQSSSCKVIEVMASHVRKMYPSRRRWAGVKSLYEVLAEQRIPFVERLVRWDEMRLLLDFKPRGLPVKPSSVDGLLQALKCVCTALVALHNIMLMHRDLCWENVMKRSDIQDEEQWFLIDFEDAAFEEGGGSAAVSSSAATSPFRYYYPHRLSPTRHAPEMSRGAHHGLKVDVWGLGYLIKTCALPDLPSHLHDLQLRFMDPDPDLRPSIEDCLYLIIQLQQSSLTSATASSSLHFGHHHHHR